MICPMITEWSSNVEFVSEAVLLIWHSFSFVKGKKNLYLWLLCTDIYGIGETGPCGTAWYVFYCSWSVLAVLGVVYLIWSSGFLHCSLFQFLCSAYLAALHHLGVKILTVPVRTTKKRKRRKTAKRPENTNT